MSTLEEFENAPVGSIARIPNTANIMVKGDPYLEYPWTDLTNAPYTSEEVADLGFSLDPIPTPAPTSAREALDLAWELAHPVKEGQVIPAGTDYLVSRNGERPATMRTNLDQFASKADETNRRTLDPLPDPEPDWLDAPAVIAACTYCEFEGGDGPQVTIHGPFFDGQRWECTECHTATDWTNLRDVTPLYPKEG